jgi:hypothetical protein
VRKPPAVQLRQVLTFGPGLYLFRPSDYPWIAEIRFTNRGGAGGAASDGTPGEPGTCVTGRLLPPEFPPAIPISVGRGGRGAPGAQDGEDGSVILELYERTLSPARWVLEAGRTLTAWARRRPKPERQPAGPEFSSAQHPNR